MTGQPSKHQVPAQKCCPLQARDNSLKNLTHMFTLKNSGIISNLNPTIKIILLKAAFQVDSFALYKNGINQKLASWQLFDSDLHNEKCAN